jgi:hypothetical protein
MFFMTENSTLKYGVRPEEVPLVFPDEATVPAYGYRNMNRRGRFLFKRKVARAEAALDKFYEKALLEKACYFGPFVGEFGHFLLHNLLFVMHLHQMGVAIHYCGMSLHTPFLLDSTGQSLISEAHLLRDFFGEVKPVSNETIPPADVVAEVDRFRRKAKASGLPFLDISDKELYWYAFRNWQLRGKQHLYSLKPVYASGGARKNCVIFPRKKGGEFTANNGGPWDYMELARAVSPYFDEVILTGHPSLSAEVVEEGNIKLGISANNADTLRYCANAELIITQHSGAVHLGAYTETQVLVIFNGNPPIKGLIDTLRFRKNLTDTPLRYAFSLDEIKTFASAEQM